MLKKLRLDQTKAYEKCLALEEISTMLVSFVKGHPYHLAIGAEQGNIDKWDDLVIQKNNGSYIYIQAKRQITDFSCDSIVRDTYRRRPRIGELRDLSPLDRTLESLGKRINSIDYSLTDIKDEFWLELPESSTKIKEGLEIRHFRYLLEVQFRSVTTADDLANLSNNDTNTQNIFSWLTTWCGFSDWEHIFKLLKILKVRTSGSESDIVFRVNNNLSHIFKSTEVVRVRSLILSYIDENATFAGAIKPRQLLYQLEDYLLPNVYRWTLFQTDGLSWSISGIHDLEDNNEIERPSVIVPALWSTGNPNARFLGIGGSCVENCLVSYSLMRLSLHPQGSFDIICSDKSTWQNSIRSKTGGTLGVTKNDLNNLRMLDGLEPSSPGEQKELITIDEQEDFAKKLHSEMYKFSLKYVNNAISSMIRLMSSGDLRTEIESRWMGWKQLLENNVEEQRKLFSKILHPEAEGESISGELRVGPITADLLSEAIFLLLVVSVCLGDDENKSWGSVTDKLKMESVGLAYWSGPGGSRKVIKIDDDAGIGKLLEKEPGQIIIIPQSELTDTEAFNDDIFGEITKCTLLTHPRYPKLLITQNREFKRKLNIGNIQCLREYFQKYLDKYEDTIECEVKQVVDGVII